MWINDLTLMLPPFMRTFLNLASYAGALIIIAFVTVSMKKLMSGCNNKRELDLYFLRVCYILLLRMVMLILFFLSAYIPVEIEGTLIVNMLIKVWYQIMEVLKVLFPLSWLAFIDYSVYKSSKRVRNKYKYALIPIAVLVVLNIASNVVSEIEKTNLREILESGKTPISVRLTNIYNISGFVVCFGYMVYAYLIVRSYSKEMKQPLFVRLDTFIVPWALGIIVTVISGINFDSLFNSFGLLFTFNLIKKGYRYRDPETNFYNEKFLLFLSMFLGDKEIKEGSALYLESDGFDHELGRVLWKYRIPKSVVVKMDKGGYLILAYVNDKNALESYDLLIRDASKAEDEKIIIKSSKWFRDGKEKLDEFFRRVLAELA